jgi:redox-sensitive bicupin YhaK (pirin superfamily)
LMRDELAVLSRGEQVQIRALHQDSRFLMIAGMPLNEPVARGGPFVMNHADEINQAFADYKAGRF